MKEKRKHTRHQLSFPVECRRVGKSDYFYTVSKNLSAGGAKILSNNFLPKNEHFKIGLNLVKEVFHCKARVAWCNRESFSDRYTTGLEFVDCEQLDKAKYSAFLETINS